MNYEEIKRKIQDQIESLQKTIEEIEEFEMSEKKSDLPKLQCEEDLENEEINFINQLYGIIYLKSSFVSRLLFKMATEWNPRGWVPDWENDSEIKFGVYYNKIQNRYGVQYEYTNNHNTAYFATRELAEQAIAKLIEHRGIKLCKEK